VAIFAAALLQGQQATIFGDGEATRDFVYVGDVAEAFALAVETDAGHGQRFNIGTGRQCSVNELYALIAGATGASASPHYAAARLGEVPASALDASAAKRVLGWSPETVAWMRPTINRAPEPATPDSAVPRHAARTAG
jgi:UDP-glucose 4-epimerase